MRVRAPGKLMLAGEYAVLHGRPSLVMAVDRHAVARVEAGVAQSPEVRAVLALAVAEGFVPAACADDVAVDVSALQGDGARKLGLGSSAAGCVAALGLAWVRAGKALEGSRDAIGRLARRGHRASQGGGSGVDVLASALGAVVSARFPEGLDGDAEVHQHPGFRALPWAVLWSGTPARTSDMIALAEALRAREPARFEALLRGVEEATARVDRAMRDGDARGLVEAVGAHHEAMRALGRDVGAPIVTPAMERLAARVGPLGGAVKPSGAGGGDVVLAVAVDTVALGRCLDAATAEGFVPLSLTTDSSGVATD